MLRLTVVTLLHFTPHPLEVLGLSSLKTAPLQACQCPSAVAVPGTGWEGGSGGAGMAPGTRIPPWPVSVTTHVGQALPSGLCEVGHSSGSALCPAGNRWAEQEGREWGNPLPFASHSESA